jgi:hypothetical protein
VLQGELEAVKQAKLKLEDKNRELEEELRKWVSVFGSRAVRPVFAIRMYGAVLIATLGYTPALN